MLHIHRAERADRLADGLGEVLLDPLADPFTADVVAVPTRGIERWLTQRLGIRLGASPGRADGVCANVEFPFPGRLVAAALATASGVEPAEDPWLVERSVWPLLEVVDRCLGEPWLRTLELHLAGARGESGEPSRRFGVVRHLADLFDRYGVHRPGMLLDWARGADPELWQAELWRRLRDAIGRPSPAERLAPACERIRAEPRLLELPARLSLFGLTRLPSTHLTVLGAIAAGREVHLFVLHPSPSLWHAVSGELATGGSIARRREDRTRQLASNRLLASWGNDARELQLVLAAAGPSIDHHHELRDPPEAERTLLARIQADIRADRRSLGPPLPGEPDGRPRLEPGDDSIQIHACHGRARQVEVLRDAVLHLLADDPTLEPRDVIVMCPDIETFAPLIQATFGAGRRPDSDGTPANGTPREGTPPDGNRLPDLRVRLADRSLRQTNPILTVVSQLLELADQRATASQLLDLAAREPVRRRFGFDDEDISRIEEWVVDSGIRWGFDASYREPFNLGGLKANTWRKGLDRILAGVAMTEEDRRLVAGVLPLDDVGSGAIELAGRFAEYVDRTRAAVDELKPAKTVERWAAAVANAADWLTATRERDVWQRRELQRILEHVVGECAVGSACGTELQLAEVRALLADRLRGRPTRANFRTGHLTVCTLVPMRSVPHRVVCILGLDDGEFPRRARRDGDDLLLAEPHVGDRDARSEDRQMLLDAVLAAGQRVIVTYTGNDQRTNLPRPPAVPVGELLDIVDRTVAADDGPARERVLIRHPLQPFDPRNFTPGTLTHRGPWGFDRQALAGAQALTGPRKPRAPLLSSPLPPLSEPVIELERLVRFVERPVRALLRDRLGLSLGGYADDLRDAIPVELDGLEEWGVGQRLLEGVLAGAEMDACLRAEQARGSLPPGRLSIPVLERARDVVRLIAERALELQAHAPRTLDVNLALPDGRRLAGTVTDVCGDTLRAVSYSRVKPRDRLRAWVRLLALAAARSEQPWQAVVIGRARTQAYHADVTLVRIAPLAGDHRARREHAMGRLATLLDLYDRGMREPLPLACDASAAYAEAIAGGRDGEAAARKAWASDFGRDGEDRDPAHLLAYGRELDAAELLGESPRPGERGEGWDEAETTRFGRYARRLWDPLLAGEVFTDQ